MALKKRGKYWYGDAFKITVGVPLYESLNDVRWFYVGRRCPACGMLGNYGDRTCDFPDYTKLPGRV